MFLEILKASKLIGENVPGDTVFDMSVGYNLEGIRSPSRARLDRVDEERRPGHRRPSHRPPGRVARSSFPHVDQRHHQPLDFSRLPGRRNRRHRALPAHRDGLPRVHQDEPHPAGLRRGGAPAARRAGISRNPASPRGLRAGPAVRRGCGSGPGAPAPGARPRQKPLGEIQQHAGSQEPQAGARGRPDVYVRPAAARDRFEPGEEVPRAGERPHFLLGRPGRAQHRRHPGAQSRPGDHLHGPAPSRRIRPPDPLSRKSRREDDRFGRLHHPRVTSPASPARNRP